MVDDASTDATPRIVLAHADRDPRIRLVSNQVCAGVGAARNRGVAETGAGHIAFLDADDLLTVDSVAARLDALLDAGAGMAYCWSAVIDAEDRVFDMLVQARHSGDIFLQLVRGNFISNGSSVLLTREAIEAAGGFSEALFKAGAQGCEDYLFYVRVARRFPVALVPRVLVGYRETPANMSSDAARMVRSMQLVHAELLEEHPECKALLPAALNNLRAYFAAKKIREGRFVEGLKLMSQLGLSFPRPAIMLLKRSFKAGRPQAPMPLGSVFPYATEPAP